MNQDDPILDFPAEHGIGGDTQSLANLAGNDCLASYGNFTLHNFAVLYVK